MNDKQTGTKHSHPPAGFAISVDVEDFFQVWAFSDVIKRAAWDDYDLRVGETTRRCLDLFDAANVKATFFVLGWVAERDRKLVREIVDRGHELASHGYDHTKTNEQTQVQCFEDVSRTKQILEEIGGVEVIGFRAAGFSFDSSTPWAYQCLAQAGYRYSSSSHPIAHDHYGDKDAPRVPHRPDPSSDIIEAPVATHEVMGHRVSCAGGGWFRAIPYGISKRMIAQASKTIGGPTIFYFHPWEIDPGQPRVAGASAKSKLRHYLNLSRMEGKLDRLARAFPWSRVDTTLGLRAEANRKDTAA